MKLSDFYTLLENTTAAGEIEEFDVRFEEVVSLVEQEKFDQAIPLITKILNKGNVDIRLVMYRFFAHFLGEGIGCLKELFRAIMTMLEDHWEKISPIEVREKHVLSSLTWFLSSMVKILKRSEKLHKEKRADDFWTKSLKTLTQQDLKELKTATENLGQFLAQKLEQSSLDQYTMFILRWLENLRNVVNDGEEKQPIKVEKKPIQQPPPKNSPIKPPKKMPPRETSCLPEILVSSDPMVLLFKKIQAFEGLIEKEEFEKAALISDDIGTIIKNFDPTFFFPKLFTRYFALTAAHIDVLSDEWSNKTSLKWESLNRLYQTDLEEFIQW